MREAVLELNNQLAVTLNYTSFVREDTPPDDPRCGDLLEILRAAKQPRDVVLKLLERPGSSD